MAKSFMQRFIAGDTLKARAIRSSLLTVLNFGGAQVLRLISNLILTRILFPEAFGLMALVQVVILGLGMFSVTGVKTAIIQNKRGDEPLFLNTAWVVQIGRGIILWLMVCALAWPASQLYEQPQLAILLPVAGLTAVFNGFQSTNMSSANRNLTLGRLTFVELFSQIGGIIFMITLALLTGSVWALVLGTVIGECLKTILSHLILPGIRNRLAWDKTAFLDIFHFGKYIFLGSIAGFMINTGDRAILGKFVTLTELAVYNIGYFLATVPVILSRRLSAKVLMPLYVETQAKNNTQVYAKQRLARVLITGAVLCFALILALIGDNLVRVLYEPEYHLAGPIMVLIALAYLPVMIPHAYGQQLLAMGHSRDSTYFTVLQAVVHVIILLIGIRAYGLMGAIIAPPLAVIAVYPLIAWFMARQKAWEPRTDLLLLLLCLCGAALVLWVNDTVVAQVMSSAPND